jgi:hypothetical protein
MPWACWVALSFALLSCADTHTRSEVGGETNWLRTCTSQADCAHGKCLAGVCSQACASDGDCRGPFEGSCTAATALLGERDAGTSSAVELCLPDCKSDAACGAGFACRSAVCVPAGAPASAESTRDAATPPQDAGPFGNLVQTSPAECAREQGKECSAQGTCACNQLVCRLAYPGARTQTCEPPCFDGAHSVDHAFDEGITGCVCDEPMEPFCYANSQGQGVSIMCKDGRFQLASSEECSPACDCSRRAGVGVLLPLECLCGNGSCASYDDEIAAAQACDGARGSLQIKRGCGYTEIAPVAAYVGASYTFRDADHALVGVYRYSDIVWGPCDVVSYRAETEPVPDCPEAETCDPCSGQGCDALLSK